MYRDVAQWANIRRRILVEGVSQRQAARETGISPKTIRKMLAHPHPQPYGSRSRRYPKLGPHTASIRRMLQENATLPPSARLSVMAMYERIRDQEGFRGSYGAVKDYVRPLPLMISASGNTPATFCSRWRRSAPSTSYSICPVPTRR